MIVMHGIFDIKKGAGKQAFEVASEPFAEHLRDMGLLTGWRFL